MTVYRRLWWATLVAVSVPAILLGLLSSPIPALVLSVTLVGVLVGLVLVGSDLSWRDWTDTAAGVVLIVGAAPALGRLTPFLLILAAVTSPPLARQAVGAALRADVLDEVERRNRVLFADWLARHPSPASAPVWASADSPRPDS